MGYWRSLDDDSNQPIHFWDSPFASLAFRPKGSTDEPDPQIQPWTEIELRMLISGLSNRSRRFDGPALVCFGPSRADGHESGTIS